MARYFEWDRRKAKSNLRKHGISFEEASKVFDDIHSCDEDESDEHEVRWKTTGQVSRSLIVVVHTTREEEGVEVIRIISARTATRRERRRYEENS